MTYTLKYKIKGAKFVREYTDEHVAMARAQTLRDQGIEVTIKVTRK